MPGLYPAPIVLKTFSSGSVSAGTLAELIIAPCDLEVIGLLAACATAPGANDGVTINVSNNPISQSPVGAYNLWTSTNVPSILGTNKQSYATSQTRTVIENLAYAHNYPLPGPSGTKGYVTAQSTAQTTETPVTAPPTLIIPALTALVAPDNTYTDVNSLVAPANIVHAGDLMSFVLTAAGSGASVGSLANLSIVLYCQTR